MSEKSLEICTESLGSETGSDGYSSSPPSEIGDPEENKKEEEEQQREEEKESKFFEMDEVRVVKYKISPPRSFPPPLPSLSRHDGLSLHMRSHRKNGRLVLEAVSVQSQNCFRAQRQDGRLLLTFVNSPPCEEQDNEDISTGEEQDEVEELEEVFENSEEEKEETEAENDDDDDEDEEAEEKAEEVKKENGAREMGIATEQPPKLSAGVINVHRSATMIEKVLGLANYRNTTWPPKFNEVVNFGEEVLPNSLPPPPGVAFLIPPPPAAAASFNAYAYCWQNKPVATAVLNPLTQQPPPLKNNTNKLIITRAPKGHEHQQSLLLRGGKADYLDTFLRRCKEPRRSVLIWEPYCIATS